MMRKLICALRPVYGCGRISFSVSAGKCSILGPNGAGKTSTIRILTGLSRATEGSCHVLKEQMTLENKKVRRKIGVV